MARTKTYSISEEGYMESNHVPEDFGAHVVLQSKGSWVHCSYHLTTSIAAPAMLSIPYAFTFLGWAGGLICLTIGAIVTFYSYNLLSIVLEHFDELGHRQLRFRDMAHDILGPGWGRYCVGPIQFAVCYGGVVAASLLGGHCLKAIYLLTNPKGTIALYQFVMAFGGLMLILAQVPSFHSLSHINLISLIMCLAYSACATVASIYIGWFHVGGTTERSKVEYSLVGGTRDRIFGVFSGIAVIATTFGNAIIPEIQATIAPPVKGKMVKALSLCYAIVLVTFFSVAVSGYWAFGNQAQGHILGNFVVKGNPLVPKGFVIVTNAFVTFQLVAVGVIYLQPTNEVLEGMLGDPTFKPYSARNMIPRIISRSLFVALATLIAAMFPLFGDVMGIIGAFGFLPLDFALPVIFYNITFKPSKRSTIFWVNFLIMCVFSVLVVAGVITAIRHLVIDAKSYRLFADL